MVAEQISIRPLAESDLDEADRIMRLAFGTFLGLPDPAAFMGDADYVRTRWAADPSAALGAFDNGTLVGSNFVTQWGSVGFFGPLTVEPALWDRGVARRLMDETMVTFGGWDLTHTGLFTFGQSPKHLALYQKYGFMPRFLTPVLGKATSGGGAEPTLLSEATDAESAIAACAAVTGSVYPGLDLGREIRAALGQGLGDVVLVNEAGAVSAFGVCHTGPGSEAGSGTCFVKFGAARAGAGADGRFARLLAAVESYAGSRGAGTVVAGVSTARRGAYRMMLDEGYRAALVGVTMHRPDDGAYHHPDAWVIDDWR